MTRSLTVPPAPHGPLMQPNGAAVLTAPAPSRRDAERALVEAQAFARQLRADGYDVAARALECKARGLAKALAREPVMPGSGGAP